MLLKFKIKNLQGNCQVFDNLNPNDSVVNLKNLIISEHNSINKVFSLIS